MLLELVWKHSWLGLKNRALDHYLTDKMERQIMFVRLGFATKRRNG